MPHSHVRLLWHRLCFYSVVVIFGMMCLAWSLPAAAFYRLVPRRHRSRVGQWGIMTGFRIYLAIMRATGLAFFDLRALDALAAEPPMILVSNHRSLLDAVLVMSRLPRVVCITKASLWDNRFLGGGIRMAGYIRNDTPLRLIRAAAAAVRGGQHLLIFPEGTRSASAQLAAFKPGFALVAKAAHAPVQVVILESTSPYLQKGWGLFKMPEFPLIYKARLGRRFDIGPDLSQGAAAVEAHMRELLDQGGGP